VLVPWVGPADAASGTVVPASTAVALGSAGIALRVPADGRLRGYEFAAVVLGVGFAQSAGPADESVRAPPGQQLCVVELSVTSVPGLLAEVPSTPVPGLSGAVVVGTASEPLDILGGADTGPGTYAAAIPKGSDPVLELSAAGVTQDFSLRHLKRTGPAPAVFYRGATGPDLDVSGAPSVTLQGVASDGTAMNIGSKLTAGLTYFSPREPTTTAGDLSQAYLLVQPATDYDVGTDPSFEGLGPLPPGSMQLALPDGTVVPADEVATDAGLLFGSYIFPVPGDMTSATLEIQGGVIDAVESPPPASTGGLTKITISPASVVLTFASAPFVPVKTPTSSGPSSPGSGTSPLASQSKAHHTKAAGGGIPVSAGVGAGGGVVVLVLVIVIPIRRRRYPYGRAERQGQLVVYAPPALPRPPIALPPVAVPVEADDEDDPVSSPGVEVRVLGPIELVGLVGRTGRRAVDELLVFLALHPGQVFSSAELRSRIWAYPRREPTAKDFRNTLYYLRKALPPGAYETTPRGPKLTEVVSTDWGLLLSLVDDTGDARSESLTRALGNVRGHPFAEATGRGDDSPYDWAYRERLAPEMEATVEKVAHELATAMLEEEDTEHARWAIDRGFRCVPESLLLYGDLLRVGAARDGAAGVERAMGEARRILGDDATTLEGLAAELAGA
jgi:hypothetical protein